jgi:hypothetical protein
MVPTVGLEPTTTRLRAVRSEPCALPTELDGLGCCASPTGSQICYRQSHSNVAAHELHDSNDFWICSQFKGTPLFKSASLSSYLLVAVGWLIGLRGQVKDRKIEQNHHIVYESCTGYKGPVFIQTAPVAKFHSRCSNAVDWLLGLNLKLHDKVLVSVSYVLMRSFEKARCG